MKTFQEEWKNYRDKVYPKGIGALQNKELHQAFFAGVLVTLQNVQRVSQLPEDEAVEAVKKMAEEATLICNAIAAAPSRN